MVTTKLDIRQLENFHYPITIILSVGCLEGFIALKCLYY